MLARVGAETVADAIPSPDELAAAYVEIHVRLRQKPPAAADVAARLAIATPEQLAVFYEVVSTLEAGIELTDTMIEVVDLARLAVAPVTAEH